jgi:hypothetical protein
MFVDRPGKMSVASPRSPTVCRRKSDAGSGRRPACARGKDALPRSQLATLRMTKLLYDSGIPLVAGTDDLAGFTLHRELELYVKAGIKPSEVLRIATLGAARVARKDQELGSITPGKLADMVLVDGDPAKQISDVRHTALVIKDGSFYEPAALYKALGVNPNSRRTARTDPAPRRLVSSGGLRAFEIFSKNRIDERGVRGGGFRGLCDYTRQPDEPG